MRSLRFVLALAGLMLVSACSDDSKQPRHDFTLPPGGDGGTGTEAGTPPGNATIMDINQKKPGLGEGVTVTLADVIVTAVDGYGSYGTGNVYVQDPSGAPYGGLMLFAPSRTDGAVADLKAGDHVTVKGKLQYYTPSTSPYTDGKVLIEVAKGGTIAKLSSGPAPAPKEITPTDLATEEEAVKWQFMLVKMSDQAVTGCFNSSNNEFRIGGVRVDDELFLTTPAPNFGDCETITGILGYHYDYKLWPRSADDVTAGSGCPTVASVAISDIQNDASPAHPTAPSPVIITGTYVVTAADTVADSKGYYSGFWIGDPAGGEFSGIYVYSSWMSSYTVKPVVGNTVTIKGTYVEFQRTGDTDTVSEIQDICIEDKGAGTLPPATIVNAADIATGGSQVKNYEGVLVKVENVSIGDAVTVTLTGGGTKTIGFKLSGSNLIVQNDLYDLIANNPATAGVTYKSITGVLHEAKDNMMLLPRSDADLVK